MSNTLLMMIALTVVASGGADLSTGTKIFTAIVAIGSDAARAIDWWFKR